MKIMWGITGAGDLLKESLEELERISFDNEITIIFSKSGLEVYRGSLALFTSFIPNPLSITFITTSSNFIDASILIIPSFLFS